jgi:hypothetical protein
VIRNGLGSPRNAAPDPVMAQQFVDLPGREFVEL